MLQLLIFWNAPIFDLRTFSFNMRFATDINVGRKIRYHLCLYYGKDGFRRKNCTPLSTRKVNICTAVIKDNCSRGRDKSDEYLYRLL